MNTATQKTGAVQPDVKVEVRPNPRNVAIEAMTARMEKAREDELQEAVENDPGLASKQNAINNEIEAANQEAEREGLLVRPDSDLDGAASREAMHPPEDLPAAEEIPAELAGDPLAEYIVMQNGQPMFQMKIDGQMRLIPLDQARRELQIGTAAAIRMNEATAIKQSLDERELRVTAQEAALKTRMETAPASPSAAPVTPPTGLSDEDLYDEANEIFNTAFSGTEEDAAKKLAKSLIKIRDAATTSTQPPIDTQAIVRQAATVAVSAVDERDRKKDVHQGYDSFKKDYPDIMNDPHLYKMADDMTDEIAREHPEWDISQVMDESGKRTRAWVNNLKGIEDTDNPAPPPTDENTNAVTTLPTQETRQERKSGLVRMPAAATGAVHQEVTVEDDAEQSPLEALNELKAARGQPV
jgi:hypothetical protein